jgi:hypothetical protein
MLGDVSQYLAPLPESPYARSNQDCGQFHKRNIKLEPVLRLTSAPREVESPRVCEPTPRPQQTSRVFMCRWKL